ncbi:ABC transporter permease [Anaerobaca lacustris]|uniref:ABC transporter permease n=1 Tax=Anaerobaca lacustris TaxID=3044600 RepID=A0AAW6TTT5_9BACT|nr:ABC transporter permease [Sedimentisphaerales bacterium M17dextr]
MTTLWQDVRYGVRMLRKNPGFTVVAVVSLALGIGANTGIFTIFEQVLLRSLPVKDAGALVILTPEGKYIGSQWGGHVLSYPMFKDFQADEKLFDGVLCRRSEIVVMNDGRGAERIEIALVSGNYFEVLGVPPALGRTFVADDETAPGTNPVIVLSCDFWRSRFGGDPNVVGRTLRINDTAMEVVGVAVHGFNGLSLDSRPRLFLPITMKPQVSGGWERRMDDRRTQWVQVFSRLKPGLSCERAEVAIQTPYKQIIQREVEDASFAGVPAEEREQFLQSRLVLLPGRRGLSYLTTGLGRQFLLLMGLAGLVLLVTCANVSNLLVARTTRRQKEIMVRLAIGAGRWRIMRQVLVESLLLACAGGAAALLVAALTARAILRFAPGQLSLTLSPEINETMLAFNVILSAVAALLCGLVPAWRTTQVDLASTLKQQATSITGGRGTRLRQGMVVTQICLSLILLVASGLFIRSLAALYRIDPGFRPMNLVCFGLDLTRSGHDGPPRVDFCRQLRTQLRSIPGVTSTAFAKVPLLENDSWYNGIVVEGYEPKPGEDVASYCNSISPDYCRTVGMTMRLGREFNERDEMPGAGMVILVNEAFVRWFLPDRHPVGCRVGLRWSTDAQPDREIVGVVCDSRNANLRSSANPQVFFPYSQIGIDQMTVYARTSLPSQELFSAIRRQVRRLDDTMPLLNMRTMEDQLDRSLANERLIGFLSSLFGILATALAMIGLYGVTAYSVAQRVQEIGIRMALGAQRPSVVSLVLREGMTLAGIGVMVGLAGAFALTRVLRSWLFEISPTDPLTFSATALLLTAVALLACYLPARRAARVDPMVALRHE